MLEEIFSSVGRGKGGTPGGAYGDIRAEVTRPV